MFKPVVAIEISDNQQTNRSTRHMAYDSEWRNIDHWDDVPKLVADAWEYVNNIYPAYTSLKTPKTLQIKVGIRYQRTKVRYYLPDRGKKLLRVFPTDDERFCPDVLAKRLYRDLEDLVEKVQDSIDDLDQLLATYRPKPKQESNLFSLSQNLFKDLLELETGSCCSW